MSVLEYKDFSLGFNMDGEVYPAVEKVNLTIGEGEMVALIGESGCGKSQTALAAIGLSPDTSVYSGTIAFQGQNLLNIGEKDWQKLRGKQISMIFQEPMTALNPLQKVGNQIGENLLLHSHVSRVEAKKQVLAMLKEVGLPDVERVYSAYPHQLSGGQRQRIMIAMAFINHPKLLIADEPTTALDVTIQAQILALMKKMNETENTAVLFISHDLRVIRRICRRVYIMYSGVIVESGFVEDVLHHPEHPYTKGLIAAVPDVSLKGRKLASIPGSVPPLETRKHAGCPFADRCFLAKEKCHKEMPEFITNGEHQVRCFYASEEWRGGRND